MSEPIVFIYKKKDKIKVLGEDTATWFFDELKNNGWEHIKTINATTFIEQLFNENKILIESLK